MAYVGRLRLSGLKSETGEGPIRIPVYCHNVITKAQNETKPKTKTPKTNKTHQHKSTKPSKPKGELM